MPDVFISYSRQTLEFVQQLVAALKKNGKDPWFDQLKEPLSGIAAGAPWWKQIQDGIEDVDNFLFVITPNSIKSPYCHAEINFAREHGKRLVPVLYCGWIGEAETRKAIDAAIESIPDSDEIPSSVTSSILNLKKLVRANWLAISEIQYVTFSSSVPFEQSIDYLLQALDLDLAWVRMHSQLTQAAKLWEANDFHEDFLWGPYRLKPVYEMIERRKPELDILVKDFIEPEQERLLREIAEIETNHQRRRWIGERLATIGDSRTGIGLNEYGVPQIDWLFVAQGGKIEIQGQTFWVQPFYVAKYLITYRQFEAFLNAPDGFEDERWWQGFPDKYVKQQMSIAIAQYDNYPRDSVSWYQAVAFSRWLDAKCHEHNLFAEWLDGDWEIRLPTEQEWQWMAQNGVENREYPWGKWDERPRANTTEAGIGNRSMAVGMYPDGRAECGALDVAGNLFEWCLNDYKTPEVIDGYDNGERKVLRGGSFNNYQYYAAASSRLSYTPDSVNAIYGFRLVLSASIASLGSGTLASGSE